jgi:uncharacterized protein YbdZ (MbtH family)
MELTVIYISTTSNLKADTICFFLLIHSALHYSLWSQKID